MMSFQPQIVEDCIDFIGSFITQDAEDRDNWGLQKKAKLKMIIATTHRNGDIEFCSAIFSHDLHSKGTWPHACKSAAHTPWAQAFHDLCNFGASITASLTPFQNDIRNNYSRLFIVVTRWEKNTIISSGTWA